MNEEREARVMSEVAEGNISAFREIVELHQKSLLNFISRFTGDKIVAEDIAQEVFLKVYLAAGSYVPKSKFRTWLFKIATNHCLNHLRDNKCNTQTLDLFELNEAGFIAIAPDNYCPERICEKKELSQIVQTAIINLPQKQQVAILLQKYDGFSYKEISQVLGCSVSAVESLIQRARQNLRKTLASTL